MSILSTSEAVVSRVPLELATSARAVAYLPAGLSDMRAPRAPPPRGLTMNLEDDKVASLRGLNVAVEEEKERENGFGELAVDDVDNAATVAVFDCNTTGFRSAAIVDECREMSERIRNEEECGGRK